MDPKLENLDSYYSADEMAEYIDRFNFLPQNHKGRFNRRNSRSTSVIRQA